MMLSFYVVLFQIGRLSVNARLSGETQDGMPIPFFGNLRRLLMSLYVFSLLMMIGVEEEPIERIQ